MPPASAPTPVVYALTGAGKRYCAFEALAGLTLEIRARECVGIIGPSGAGKSTLLRLLNTASLPTSGRVQVLGMDPSRLGVHALRKLRTRIGTVHQGLDLVPQASVFHNVVAARLGRRSLFSTLRAMVSREEVARVEAVLSRLGIGSKLFTRLDRLSGGEQQRVATARVLYQEPEILLADEPLASVDPARSAEIIQLLLHAAEGRTLIVTTHQLEPVIDHLTRVIGLRAGKLLFDKPPHAITAEDYAELYQLDGARRVTSGAPARTATEAPRLGATELAARLLLPPVLQGLRRDRPEAKVEIALESASALIDAIRAGRVQAALVDERIPAPDVHYEELSVAEVVLVATPALIASAGSELSAALIARAPRVERTPLTPVERLAQAHFAQQGVPLEPGAVRVHAATAEVHRAALLAGAGFGFAPRVEVQAELERGALAPVPLEAPPPALRLHVAARSGEPLLRAVQQWVEAADGSAPRVLAVAPTPLQPRDVARDDGGPPA